MLSSPISIWDGDSSGICSKGRERREYRPTLVAATKRIGLRDGVTETEATKGDGPAVVLQASDIGETH